MADPTTYRPAPGTVPASPGVYRFRDIEGRVVYVGKAKNLRSRLNSYFADMATLHPRTQTMVTTAAGVDWTVVSNEVEALQLEYTWIKEFDPRFNVKYRDDKSYPYLAVTLGEEFPRVQVMRGTRRKGTRYFGPYTQAWAIRETVDLLLRVFPLRTCSSGVFQRASQSGRPCLLGYIDKCSAPCVGRISVEDHRQLAEDFCDFMAGRTQRFVRRLEDRMQQASTELDYERAARLRDDISVLNQVLAKSAVVLPDATDADVFGLAEDDLEAAVHVFHVRGGRIRGQRGWVVEKVEAVTTGDLIEHLLQQVYGEGAAEAVPREVLVPEPPSHPTEIEVWLTGRRGSRVRVRVPQRGAKRDLLRTVARNAVGALTLHKTRRVGDLTTRSQALQELQNALGLDRAPLRIECYDVSHLQQDQIVASMVVFEDGLPRKGEYRRFVIRGEQGRDDLSAMREVIGRRMRRHLQDRQKAGLDLGDPEAAPEAAGADLAQEQEQAGSPPGIDPETGRPHRFAYVPSLVVVDGGPTQVAAAVEVLDDLGIDDIAVVGLAKRLEEIWVPGQEFPVVLPRSGQGLYLMQRVRDEAHRFAISHHRQRRSRAMTASVLDDVPGLGPVRGARLLKVFGSVRRLRQATEAEIAEIPGIGPAVASAVVSALAESSAPVAVDTVTGEIIN